jgi:hypothetical protein
MNDLGDEDILAFLHAIDDELAARAAPDDVLPLYLIGSAALIVRYGVRSATKDVDIVHFHGSTLEEEAVKLFGKGTPNAERWGFYLEGVPQGLPPIPQGYCARCEILPGEWKAVRPMQPEPHDLAVTKLKRFHAKDRQDLQILCESGDVSAERLREALESAFLFAADEDEDHGRKRAFLNLERVVAFLEGRSIQL